MDDILDFDQQIAEEATEQAKEPVPFRFHGEIFKAHGEGPGMVILEFAKAAADNNGMAAVGAMLDFLRACMPTDEYERFHAVCVAPDIVTPVAHIALVVRGLMAKYDEPDGRPTMPSSASPAGSRRTAGGSKGGSRSTASRSAT